MYFLTVVFILAAREFYLSDGWLLPPKACSYPWSSQGNFTAEYNDYFYGHTSLWNRRNKRAIISTTRLRHSLLLFRGKIFEWGSKRYPWPKLGRPLWSCAVNWEFVKIGRSQCTMDEIETWNQHYFIKYGRYRLFSNNCHHFVNRLAFKLSRDCRTSYFQYVRKSLNSSVPLKKPTG